MVYDVKTDDFRLLNAKRCEVLRLLLIRGLFLEMLVEIFKCWLGRVR